MISLGLVITTIGRPSLKTMLDSIIYQLKSGDLIYLLVDGPEFSSKVTEILKNYDPSKIIRIDHNKNLGFWGHGLRNEYQKGLTTTHILHGDDDDIYLPNAIDNIRKNIELNGVDKLLIFKFLINKKGDSAVWVNKSLRLGNIGTPSGVLPNNPDKMGVWGYRYGGDFDFYKSCKFDINFVDEIIYRVNK